MKKLLTLFLAALPVLMIAQEIDDRSRITFDISNFYVNTVEGSFSGINGKVNFDPERVEKARFDIIIPIRTIKTGNDTRDSDLQAEQYFHAEKYPNARFVATSVSGSLGMITVTGDLTIKGVTNKVSIPFQVTRTAGGYLLSGDITLDRYSFNVGESGSFMMGREAELDIQLYLSE